MASPAFFRSPHLLNHHHHINLSTTKSHNSHQFFIQHFSIVESDCACISSQITRGSRRTNLSSLKALPDSTTIVDESPVASAAATLYSEEEEKAMGRIGARVRVKVPLKVYHIPKVPEVELDGREGVLKQYIAVWKGKRISANFPFKVGFVSEIEGRDGSVKFFVHLKEEEFEFLD